MAEAPSEPPQLRRRGRRGRFFLFALIVIVVAVIGASRINLNYYVLSPGQAKSVRPLITVPPHLAHRGSGSILLTDVFVSRVSLLGYLPALLSSDDEIVPTAALTGGVPSSEFNAQGYLEMLQSKAAAKAAALDKLGYTVPEQDAGVVIESVAAGTPAEGTLHVGWVVTSVNGVATLSACSFTRQLSELAPGTRVRFGVTENRFSARGRLLKGPVGYKSLVLAKRPANVASPQPCAGLPQARGFVGIGIQTQQDFSYPFAIRINTADIGGPSAGLAMTLGLIDTLSGGHLTGGRIVAATGTIDPNGNIGDVGGVPQKTLAVERAGAKVFFVPRPELAAARAKATPSLHVYAVNTLDQVLSILKKLGGRISAP